MYFVVLYTCLTSRMVSTMFEYKGFTVKTTPWTHQYKALCYLYPRDCGALYTKPGSGKTKVLIDLIINRGFKRILVLGPINVCPVWVKQLQIHSEIPDSNIVYLPKLSMNKKAELVQKTFSESHDKPIIYICNYESVWRTPLQRVWFYKKLGLDCVICDESHKIKSPGGKCSLFLKRLGAAVPHRYLMTGTPLAERPEDIYAQYRFLDPSIYGTNYQAFCNRYQNIDPIATSRVGHTILDSKEPYKNMPELHEKMYSCAFAMEATVKLPVSTRKVIHVPMPQPLVDVYTQVAKKGAYISGDLFMTAENVLALSTYKQQITSGYLKLEDDEGKIHTQRLSTYRRTFLYQFIKTLPEEPLVVFARFKKDLYSIRKVAEKLGCGYSELSGSENTLEEWQQSKTRIIGVQYNSGAEGIDMTHAHTCIFYTLPNSLAQYTQALARIRRPGQTFPCTYYHIIATMDKGQTVDEHILQSLRLKKEYISMLMAGDFSDNN